MSDGETYLIRSGSGHHYCLDCQQSYRRICSYHARSICEHPGCSQTPRHRCGSCDARFCDYHGTEGLGSPFAKSLEPPKCWQHGGYDADACPKCRVSGSAFCKEHGGQSYEHFKRA